MSFENTVGKEEIALNPFPNKPWFLCVLNSSLLKTLWEKEQLLVTSNFSFSHSFFYPFGELSAIFIKFEIVVCKHRVWRSLKFVVWETVKEQFLLFSVFSTLSSHILIVLCKHFQSGKVLTFVIWERVKSAAELKHRTPHFQERDTEGLKFVQVTYFFLLLQQT